MKLYRRGFAAAAAVALVMAGAVSAQAADLPEFQSTIVAPAGAGPPPPPGFGWGGVYIGPFGAITFLTDCEECDNLWSAGGTVGLNITSGQLLVGFEVQAGATFLEDPLFSVGAGTRAGVLLGDRALLYVQVGLSTTLPFPGLWVVNAGGGLEIAVGNRVSVFVEGLGNFILNGPGLISTTVQAGLNFHL